MKFTRRSWTSALLVILLLVLVFGAVLLLLRRDEALDWAFSRGYHPTATVQQLVYDTTMTPTANRLFYANRPRIENKDAFNKVCPDTSDQVSTLGCFIGNRQGIYLYNVTEHQLSGVQQVTAAHEMLHQAYERLSSGKRKSVDAMLQSYYKNSLTNDSIRQQIQSYTKTEPGQLVNEMHSILGTEVATLPPDLETYYKQYFTNRPQIAQYYANYQSAFDQRNKQIQAYTQQLQDLKTQIDVKKNDLADLGKEIDSRRAQLNADLAANRIAAYNNGVPGFNALVDKYRNEVSETNDLIDQYNQISAARNAIDVQEQQLQQALDSHFSGAAAQ